MSTLKLVATLDEQRLLEDLLESTKPPVPADCRDLHYLLASPFRYGAPYPAGSRFRRAGGTEGVFYASEAQETALGEIIFHRLLFFAASPATAWPANAPELTAFSSSISTEAAIDLQKPPLSDDHSAWSHPSDYGACQDLCDAARGGNIEVIRYQSVRDPRRRANVAVLSCRAFARPRPLARQVWQVRLSGNGVQAIRQFPPARLEFSREAFSSDARIAAMNWDR